MRPPERWRRPGSGAERGRDEVAMSSVAMWRGCRRLWWAHSPPVRLPRPPPAAAGSCPVGPCGRRAYAPPAGEGALGRLQPRLGRGVIPWGSSSRDHPGQGWDRYRLTGTALPRAAECPRCWGSPPCPFPGVNVSAKRARFTGSTPEPSLNQFVPLVSVFCWGLGTQTRGFRYVLVHVPHPKTLLE